MPPPRGVKGWGASTMARPGVNICPLTMSNLDVASAETEAARVGVAESQPVRRRTMTLIGSSTGPDAIGKMYLLLPKQRQNWESKYADILHIISEMRPGQSLPEMKIIHDNGLLVPGCRA